MFVFVMVVLMRTWLPSSLLSISAMVLLGICVLMMSKRMMPMQLMLMLAIVSSLSVMRMID